MPSREHILATRPTYVRFQTRVQYADSHRPTGVFQAASQLRERGVLTSYEEREIARHLGWLGMHLNSPSCLREWGNLRAISWVHPRAKEPIRRVRAIVELLREHGVIIYQITTRRPGMVVYEDGWQVVAKPYPRRGKRRAERRARAR